MHESNNIIESIKHFIRQASKVTKFLVISLVRGWRWMERLILGKCLWSHGVCAAPSCHLARSRHKNAVRFGHRRPLVIIQKLVAYLDQKACNVACMCFLFCPFGWPGATSDCFKFVVAPKKAIRRLFSGVCRGAPEAKLK